MSRIAKAPIAIASGVDVNIDGQHVAIKGGKGSLEIDVHALVNVSLEDGVLSVSPVEENREGWTMAGTMRSLLDNMVTGVSAGFEKKLTLIGVGYRAQAKGQVVNLSLGFSHPVEYQVREGVTCTTPSQTEIIVSGCDKQSVGQVAADIRRYRPPEPYKGKGVRYSDEYVIRKQAKKK